MAKKDSLLERVTKDYNEWENYSRPYRNKWLEFWKLWNNTRSKQQYMGDSDSFDPMTFQMVESITDNVYGSRPKLTFLPTNRHQETDTKILNGLWDYTWDKNNMDGLIIPWGREITITGNGALFASWEDGCMKIMHIPIRDCILDATASSPRDMKKAGYRRLALLEDLKKAKRYDPKQDAWVPRYKNLDNLQTYGGGDQQTDKELKDMLAGSTLTDEGQKTQVEVIYMMYLDKFVEVANRQQVIAEFDNELHKDAYETDTQAQDEKGQKLYDETTLPEGAEQMDPESLAQALAPAQTKVTVPAIDPFIPVVLQGEFRDAALLLAKGDVEPFSDTQEDVNDTLNMLKDNIAYNVKNVAIADTLRATPEQLNELAEAQPGSIVGITGGETAISWMEKPNMSVAAAEEMMRAKQSIRDTARVDEVVQGVSDNQEKTATEIKTQVAQATSGFSTKTRALEAGAYKDLGEIFIKFNQIFLTEKQMVRILTKQGVQFETYDPQENWGFYDCKVVLESAAEAKKKQDAEITLKMMELFAGDPDFNQIELKKLALERAFDMDEDDLKLLMNSDPNNGAMMGGAPTGDMAQGAGGAPMPMPPPPPPSATAITSPSGQVHESADLVKLYTVTANRPDVQNQILELLGFDPGEEPPMDLVQSDQEMAHKAMDMGMKMDSHEREMNQPQEPQTPNVKPKAKAKAR